MDNDSGAVFTPFDSAAAQSGAFAPDTTPPDHAGDTLCEEKRSHNEDHDHEGVGEFHWQPVTLPEEFITTRKALATYHAARAACFRAVKGFALQPASLPFAMSLLLMLSKWRR
jgi:hypothetical protein